MQVQRYISLTRLIPEMLQKLDDDIISFSPAVEISALKEEEQTELLDVHENCGKAEFKISDFYEIVPKEEIAGFESTMQKIITEIISEASGIACWVYVEKYINHKILNEMLEEWHGADKFIVVMDIIKEKGTACTGSCPLLFNSS